MSPASKVADDIMKSAGIQSSADFSAAKPHLATLNDGASPLLKELYELRVKASKEMSRVIFTLSGDDIVLLYAFKKKCNRDNEKAFERAFKMNKFSEELTEVCI